MSISICIKYVVLNSPTNTFNILIFHDTIRNASFKLENAFKNIKLISEGCKGIWMRSIRHNLTFVISNGHRFLSTQHH